MIVWSRILIAGFVRRCLWCSGSSATLAASASSPCGCGRRGLTCRLPSMVPRAPPRYHMVHRLLTNPIYAGAYVFGRTGSRVRLEGGRKVIVRGFVRRREEWEVLIRDHHDGYISWEEYDRNQKIIAGNANMKGTMVGG